MNELAFMTKPNSNIAAGDVAWLAYCKANGKTRWYAQPYTEHMKPLANSVLYLTVYPSGIVEYEAGYP